MIIEQVIAGHDVGAERFDAGIINADELCARRHIGKRMIDEQVAVSGGLEDITLEHHGVDRPRKLGIAAGIGAEERHTIGDDPECGAHSVADRQNEIDHGTGARHRGAAIAVVDTEVIEKDTAIATRLEIERLIDDDLLPCRVGVVDDARLGAWTCGVEIERGAVLQPCGCG